MNIRNAFLLLLPLYLYGQEPAKPPALTLESVMRDAVWIGEIPSAVVVAPDGRHAYFNVDREVPLPGRNLQINLDSAKTGPLESQFRAAAQTDESFVRGKIRIDSVAGDLWLAEGDKPAKPLLSLGERIVFVRFLDDQRFVYRANNQLFRHDLSSGATVKLTKLSWTDKKKDEKSYLATEERRLIKFVDDQYRLDTFEDEHEAEGRQFGELTRPGTIYLGKGYELGNRWTSKDSRHLLDISEDQSYLALVAAPDKEEENTQYAQFINREASVKALDARGRVTFRTKTWKAAVIEVKTGTVHWLDFSSLPEIKTDRLAEIKASLTEEQRAFLPKARGENEPRPVEIACSGFLGKQLLLTVFSADFKDRWIVLVNAETREMKVIDHHYDPAWVQYSLRNLDVPNEASGAAQWNAKGTGLYYISDKDGYQHLYTYDLASAKTTQLTKGPFEIFNPFESRDGYWYLHANQSHPGVFHFYQLQANGNLRQLTEGEGFHEVTIDLDGDVMIDRFSRPTLPPMLRVRKGNGPWKDLYDGRSEEFRRTQWVEPEVVTYTNRDGKQVYARLYKPTKSNGAGVIFTHGAGYLQNAHKGWSTYQNEFMFHNLLVQQGYTVLDPDYQGSAGYGRDCRTAIYRHMGGRDLGDLIDGADYLVKSHGLDPKRLGTYGGSYGGFLTFMAMFTSPGTFQAGAALRPVSDWAHYNHWYTSRILNTPEEDPIAYRRSSPIYFAEGLQGHLLICHGVVDDNVHFIDSVRLSQRLIELGKKRWEFAPYPVERHSFRTASSWTDEYRRILELFERTLR